MLGVLEFCESRGVSEPGAIEFLRKSTRLYDGFVGAEKGDEAEATGKRGVLAGRGVVKPLEESATKQHRSVNDICRDIVGLYKRAADNFARRTGTDLPK